MCTPIKNRGSGAALATPRVKLPRSTLGIYDRPRNYRKNNRSTPADAARLANNRNVCSALIYPISKPPAAPESGLSFGPWTNGESALMSYFGMAPYDYIETPFAGTNSGFYVYTQEPSYPGASGYIIGGATVNWVGAGVGNSYQITFDLEVLYFGIPGWHAALTSTNAAPINASFNEGSAQTFSQTAVLDDSGSLRFVLNEATHGELGTIVPVSCRISNFNISPV